MKPELFDFLNNLVSILIGLSVFFGGFRRWFRRRVTEPIENMEKLVDDMGEKVTNLSLSATMLSDQLNDVTGQLDAVKRMAERAHQRLDEHVNAHVRAGMSTSGEYHG